MGGHSRHLLDDVTLTTASEQRNDDAPIADTAQTIKRRLGL
jgi:hypothetical protein